MPCKEFRNDEIGYQKWLAQNVSGFVLNIRKNLSKNYAGLHRASCSSIRISGRSSSNVPFTGEGYIKICAKRFVDLDAWLKKATKGARITRYCKLCSPLEGVAQDASRLTSARIFHKINIAIPRYPGVSAPIIEVRSARPPLPPRFSDVKRRGKPNSENRQKWFERRLEEIALSQAIPKVPWYFETKDKKRWKLDLGAVGHAIANNIIKRPSGESARLQFVSLLPPFKADSDQEISRLKRWAPYRKDQSKFSYAVRQNYGGRCTVTGCKTAEALQAAHIRVFKNKDANSLSNGILLRSDIHALLDAHLITFSKDGKRLKASTELTDRLYRGLNNRRVWFPDTNPPSLENISSHRRAFFVANQK